MIVQAQGGQGGYIQPEHPFLIYSFRKQRRIEPVKTFDDQRGISIHPKDPAAGQASAGGKIKGGYLYRMAGQQFSISCRKRSTSIILMCS